MVSDADISCGGLAHRSSNGERDEAGRDSQQAPPFSILQDIERTTPFGPEDLFDAIP